MFQLGFLNILLLIVILSVIIFLPSFVIEQIWNGFYSSFLDRDLSINILQASCLWIAILSAIYMTGIVKIDLQIIDSIDLDSIDDPELKQRIEELRAKTQAKKTNKLMKSKFKAISKLDKEEKAKIVSKIKQAFEAEELKINEELGRSTKPTESEQITINDNQNIETENIKNEDQNTDNNK